MKLPLHQTLLLSAGLSSVDGFSSLSSHGPPTASALRTAADTSRIFGGDARDVNDASGRRPTRLYYANPRCDRPMDCLLDGRFEHALQTSLNKEGGVSMIDMDGPSRRLSGKLTHLMESQNPYSSPYLHNGHFLQYPQSRWDGSFGHIRCHGR